MNQNPTCLRGEGWPAAIQTRHADSNTARRFKYGTPMRALGPLSQPGQLGQLGRFSQSGPGAGQHPQDTPGAKRPNEAGRCVRMTFELPFLRQVHIHRPRHP